MVRQSKFLIVCCVGYENGRYVYPAGREFHWKLNFTITLMANSLNLNSTNFLILKNLSKMAYIAKIHKSKV